MKKKFLKRWLENFLLIAPQFVIAIAFAIALAFIGFAIMEKTNFIVGFIILIIIALVVVSFLFTYTYRDELLDSKESDSEEEV